MMDPLDPALWLVHSARPSPAAKASDVLQVGMGLRLKDAHLYKWTFHVLSEVGNGCLEGSLIKRFLEYWSLAVFKLSTPIGG